MLVVYLGHGYFGRLTPASASKAEPRLHESGSAFKIVLNNGWYAATASKPGSGSRFAAFVVAVTAVEHAVTFRAMAAQLREQQTAFFWVVELLGEFVDIEQHGAQGIEAGQRAAPTVLADGARRAAAGSHPASPRAPGVLAG